MGDTTNRSYRSRFRQFSMPRKGFSAEPPAITSASAPSPTRTGRNSRSFRVRHHHRSKRGPEKRNSKGDMVAGMRWDEGVRL